MTRELFTVVTPDEAIRRLLVHLPTSPRTETIRTVDAIDRVLAEDLTSPQNLPAFVRSTMDGFAVRAADTFGASESLPSSLSVVGEIAMGAMPGRSIGSGQCVRIATGGMLPAGADAVVMVERTQEIDDSTIEVLKPVAPGENTIAIGEDVKSGEPILQRGHILRPQDLGGLLALGVVDVTVVGRLRVAILGSGDEIVSPEVTPSVAQVRDVNSYTLASLVRRAGHEPILLGVVPDDRGRLEERATKGLRDHDILIISAGSSVSVRDLTADVIESLGEPGILVHGVSLKPGKPTILAVCEGKPVFGLPGNPVSCMVTFDLFVVPALAHLTGAKNLPRSVIRAAITRNIASKAGRVDYVAARIIERESQLVAEPVLGKSNAIHTLVRADGMIRIAAEKTGVAEGEMVEVIRF